MRSILLLLALLFPPALRAQAPQLQIAVDTAGIAAIAPNVYQTWIFSRASEHAPPSSGILVGFDCTSHLVKRYAHVVYHLVPNDSTSVEGQIVVDDTPWVAPVIPRLFDLVCSIGHDHDRRQAGRTGPPPFKPASRYPVS